MSLRENFLAFVQLSQLTQRHAVQRTSALTGEPQICVRCIVTITMKWASAPGITIPVARLRPVALITTLQENLKVATQDALRRPHIMTKT